MKRSPLTRRVPLKRSGFLKRSEFKPKRRKPDIPAKVRKLAKERSGGMCEMRVPGICTGRAVQIDHIKNRSQLGGHDVDNLHHGCLECHEWKTTHPNEAHELGIYRRGSE